MNPSNRLGTRIIVIYLCSLWLKTWPLFLDHTFTIMELSRKPHELKRGGEGEGGRGKGKGKGGRGKGKGGRGEIDIKYGLPKSFHTLSQFMLCKPG